MALRAPSQPVRSKNLFESRYGHFAPDGKSYIITRPDTPTPWVNVIANERYGCVISQAGGGFSWIDHSTLSVLTRWEMDLRRDHWGKWIYLRDMDSGDIWSASPQPTLGEAEGYRCTHGLGFTSFRQTFSDIESEWTITVPPPCGECDMQVPTLELWRLRLRNRSGRKRALMVCSHMMWCLGVSPDAKREFHRLFIENTWDAENGIITARKNLWEVPNGRGGHWNTDWPYTAYHALWVPDGSGSTALRAVGDHETFTGRHGDQRRPAWLTENGGTDAEGFGRHGDAVAAIATVLELEPGDEKDVMFALGATETDSEPSAILRPYRGGDAMDAVLKRVDAFWSSRLGYVHVDTPDPAFNLLNNVWLSYQAISARLWGRTGYWQQSGAFGYRDQLQDSQVYLPQNPDQCLAQICLHARHQFSDGTVYHWWHPLVESGLTTKKTDNLLWLPHMLANYIRETGVLDVLDLRKPFVDDTANATLWDHGKRAIERVLSRFSPRGLPLIGEGDWNDGMSACGRQGSGESVWLGHFLYLVLKEWAELARLRDENDLAAEWENRARNLRDAVNVIGWDGEWYLRATLDDGTPLGSRFSREAKIFLNAQTWAIIAGTADPDRANQVMDAVETHLLRDYGPILFTPAFSRPDARVGYLTRYAPGSRENGGVYTHAAVWAIQAACLLGRAETAWKIFSRLAPPNRSLDPDLYAVEPYVTPGNVNGPESPEFGQGGWTWYTGSAAWLRRVSLEWILGVRPTFEGLIVSPCMPAEWKSARILRPFRGNLFEIEFQNEEQARDGSWAMEVDGRPHDPHLPIPAGVGRQIRPVRVKLSRVQGEGL